MIPLLASYAYLLKGTQYAKLIHSVLEEELVPVMIDSGAFSAHRIDAEIPLEAYTKFCMDLPQTPSLWGYVQLDVVADSAGTSRNLDAQLKMGALPMPVLTVDMDEDKLADLVAVNPRVCIAGGLGQFPGAQEWVKDRFALKRHYPDAQLHGLGFVRWPDMFQCGLSSSDSSSATIGERWGVITKFFPNTGVRAFGRYPILSQQHPREWPDGLMDFLSACKVTPEQWRSPEFNAGASGFACAAGFHSYAAQSIHALRLGLVIFNALANVLAIQRLFVVMKHSRADGRGFDYPAFRRTMEKLKTYRGRDRARAVLDLIRECCHAYRDRVPVHSGRLPQMAGSPTGV